MELVYCNSPRASGAFIFCLFYEVTKLTVLLVYSLMCRVDLVAL